MIEYFPLFLAMLLLIVLLVMLANRMRVAYPVLLLLAGLCISFIPGLPRANIAPELIFIIFLPPLLYEASWAISWKELWHWRRIISSFAFVVVFLTALSVALITNHFIPGFSIALGFLLGGIVSPPDAVSAGAILKFVKIPKSMSSILEGESLLNDASSLIIFRFALIAIGTGQFIWYNAAMSFVWMVLGGVGVGLILAVLFMKLHRYLPTDSNMDILISLITPYAMYLAAEELHSSGVLAVVAGGLYLSNKRHDFLSSSSRLRGTNVWESLVFALNGLVFLLIGLDLPQITEGLRQEGIPFSTAMMYGFLVTGVLILGRIIAAYGAVVVTLIMRNFITVAQRNVPSLKVPFILGWTGMRGVVSLAAALSIPVQLANGEAFPQRNLILFITFIVILSTLLIQGLSLPYFIKKLNVNTNSNPKTEEETEHEVRRGLALHTLKYVKSNYPEDYSKHILLTSLVKDCEKLENNTAVLSLSEEKHRVYLDVLQQQRQWLLNTNRSDRTIQEEVIRKQLYQIDLEEEKLKLMR